MSNVTSAAGLRRRHLADEASRSLFVLPALIVLASAVVGEVLSAVQQLAREFNAQLQVPATREALAAQGLTLWPMTPAELDAHIRAETATWAQIIRSRRITAQ